ncbi:hypothetical protein [Selenomonas sp. AE3005]|uniref:hypothetical protein n=1 Tax=Selenomonas sp. AE3005 TaxID=1485543 RepID=UPI0004863A6B|nr:hypothetical protein [Selenomonas sp. AE3005]
MSESKWVPIRDSIVEALQVEQIGKDLKDRFVTWVEDEGIAFIQKFADGIIDECRKDAETESGWCKIRDSIVVPGLLNVGMYILKMVITKAAQETK